MTPKQIDRVRCLLMFVKYQMNRIEEELALFEEANQAGKDFWRLHKRSPIKENVYGVAKEIRKLFLAIMKVDREYE